MIEMKSFSELNLDERITEALRKANFTSPTEVQAEVIPVALKNKDVIARAKTGTGKTFAFLLPIIQMSKHSNDVEALVIAPTRELAVQIAEMANKLRLDRSKELVVVYGGASINVQMHALARNPNIVVGTPGRIIDLMDRGALSLDRLRFLVIDEADTMLDMGFIKDIEYILSTTPTTRQTMLFSATMPNRIVDIARKYMNSPAMIKVGDEDELVVTTIKHYYAVADRNMKFAVLLKYIKEYNPAKTIIFVKTKFAADALYKTMRAQGLDVIVMHGGLTQARREYSLSEFKSGAKFLIATNVAARGLDIAGISNIINFDLPDEPHTYVHRVGRSARMNADGISFSIITKDQTSLIRDIESEANIEMERINIDPSEFSDIRVFSSDRDYRHNERSYGSGREHGGYNRGFHKGGSYHGSSSHYGSRNDREGGYRHHDGNRQNNYSGSDRGGHEQGHGRDQQSGRRRYHNRSE